MNRASLLCKDHTVHKENGIVSLYTYILTTKFNLKIITKFHILTFWLIKFVVAITGIIVSQCKYFIGNLTVYFSLEISNIFNSSSSSSSSQDRPIGLKMPPFSSKMVA